MKRKARLKNPEMEIVRRIVSHVPECEGIKADRMMKEFNVGEKIRHKLGHEIWKIMGYTKDSSPQVILKPLNMDAFYGVDTFAKHVIDCRKKIEKENNIKPNLDKNMRLDCKYLDRYENIKY